MLVLSIRTDRPEAGIGLFDGRIKVAYETWPAHRQLAETLHKKIEALLQAQQKSWKDITGIVCFKGPGSFTGLRIGLSVGNALAYGLDVPIVCGYGEEWTQKSIKRLLNDENDILAMPEYGSPANTTLPKK